MSTHRWICAVASVGFALTACQSGQLVGQAQVDDELALFASSVDKKGLVQACNELQQICTATGKGCAAHDLFCNKAPGHGAADGGASHPAPGDGGQVGGGTHGDGGGGQADPNQGFREWICTQLKMGCHKFPIACDIYNKRCQGQPQPPPSHGDASVPPPPTGADASAPPQHDKAACCAALKACAGNNDCAAAATDCPVPAGVSITPDKAQKMAQALGC